MKRLIANNFLYYFKSKVKLILSLVFILSFFSMLKLYDSMELTQIRNQANGLRIQSYAISSLESIYIEDQREYLQSLNFEEETYPIFVPIPDSPWNDSEYLGLGYDGNNPEILKQVEIINRLYNLSIEYGELMNGYATLYSGGRMNVELTPYRYELSTLKLEVYDLLGEDVAKRILPFENSESYQYAQKEHQRFERLMNSQTPDFFNKYTTTFTNYPSKVLEGLMLFVTLIFTLILFYDLFSKDFEFSTYRSIYSEPYPRETIIKSKIYFAMVYTFFLILIGMLTVFLALLIERRVGYNVLANRIGYILHPTLININPLTIFNMEPIYLVVPMIVNNIIAIITGGLFVCLWIQFILYLSLKTKSSATTLTILSFVLLTIFFVNFTSLKDILSLIIPFFGFGFFEFINGSSSVNIIYFMILLIVYNLFMKQGFKHAYHNDMLGGDAHD